MAASTPIAPKSGRNHVQFDYLSPITNEAEIVIQTKGVSGVEIGAIDCDPATPGLKFDRISEWTAAAGVTIDSVLLKDGGARLLNNVSLKARNAANSADLDLAYLSNADSLVIGSSNSDIALKVGGSIYWNISNLGNLQPETDAANSIGDATKKVGNIYTRNIRRSGGSLEIITDDANAVVILPNSVSQARFESGGNIGLWGASYGGGTKVMFLGNASVAPGSNPTGGGVLYCEGGALKYRGSSGTVSELGAA